jgi:ubiquinone/menaquinone biosynthesis C-methylase UbiE
MSGLFMSTDLENTAFDHYQRYAAATALIHSLEMKVSTVLEVGANRQRLLADFLPDSKVVFSDLFAQPGSEDFIQADASALPFENAKFDVVVSLDVLEHMPPHLRAKAAIEMARVATRMVVIACPTDRPWVHAAEEVANGVWRDYFGQDYPWLEEHKEFGLVDGGVVERALLESGCKVLRFGQGDTALWSGLMSAHFVKEVIEEMRPIVASADQLYNHSVFAGDRSEQPYREYFIAVRTDEDLNRIRYSSLLTAQPDSAAVKLLSTLGASLRPIADRIRTSEEQWHVAAELVQAREMCLTQAREGWRQTAELLSACEEKQLYAAQQWHVAAELVRTTETNLTHAREGWKQTAELLRTSEEKQLYAVQQWQKTAETVRATNEQLELTRSELTKSEELLSEMAGERGRVVLQLGELEKTHEDLTYDRDRLLLRVNGLERRQRWVLRSGVALVLVAAIVMICFRII